MISGGALLESWAFLDLSVWELRPAPGKSLELMSVSYPEEGLHFIGERGSQGSGFIPRGINLAGATSSLCSKEIQRSGALLISQGEIASGVQLVPVPSSLCLTHTPRGGTSKGDWGPGA